MNHPRTYNDKVQAVADRLLSFDQRSGVWGKVGDCRECAKDVLELATGDIRDEIKSTLDLINSSYTEDVNRVRNARTCFKNILTLCTPKPPVGIKIEWNEASERGFDAKIKRELVKNALND